MTEYDNILVERERTPRRRDCHDHTEPAGQAERHVVGVEPRPAQGRLRTVEGQDLRAVVLTGAASKAFVGGADINEMAELDAPKARDFITNLHRAINQVRMLPMPVIGRIDGFCLGAGLELAAVCDMRVASEGTKLGMPEVRSACPA